VDKNHIFDGCQFSTDGAIFMAITYDVNPSYFGVFQSSDGSLIRAFTYPDSQPYIYLPTTGAMLIGGSSTTGYSIILNSRRCPSLTGCSGFQNIGYTFSTSSPASLSQIWLKISTDQASTAVPLAILFGSLETYFYSFAYQNSKVMISRISTSTGDPLKTY
jgi:hypothetical protein